MSVVDGWSKDGILQLGWSDIQLISLSPLSRATMCEMRWMDRENGIDRGWICEWEETGRIGDNWALSLLKRGLRRTDCQQEKKREIPLFLVNG